MNPRDILDVANDLLMGTREAEWRAAVSRAYYAAFHIARLLLRRCGFAVPRADQGHAYLWLRLSNCGHPDVVRAGSNLKELRSKRNWADYDLDQPLVEQDGVDAVRMAEDIIGTLEQVPTVPHVQQQITDAMKDYERDVLKDVTWQPPPP